jgi:hypothetical protein
MHGHEFSDCEPVYYPVPSHLAFYKKGRSIDFTFIHTFSHDSRTLERGQPTVLPSRQTVSGQNPYLSLEAGFSLFWSSSGVTVVHMACVTWYTYESTNRCFKPVHHGRFTMAGSPWPCGNKRGGGRGGGVNHVRNISTCETFHLI